MKKYQVLVAASSCTPAGWGQGGWRVVLQVRSEEGVRHPRHKRGGAALLLFLSFSLVFCL